MRINGSRVIAVNAVFLILWLISSPVWAAAEEAAAAGSQKPWWYWPIVLLVFCFILGVLAVLAGVGGGVLYVPLVSGFFPFTVIVLVTGDSRPSLLAAVCAFPVDVIS